MAVASAKEVGQDLEHCQTLIKKFGDFKKACTSILHEGHITYHYVLLLLSHSGINSRYIIC